MPGMSFTLAGNVAAHADRARDIDEGAFVRDGEADVHRVFADVLAAPEVSRGLSI